MIQAISQQVPAISVKEAGSEQDKPAGNDLSQAFLAMFEQLLVGPQAQGWEMFAQESAAEQRPEEEPLKTTENDVSTEEEDPSDIPSRLDDDSKGSSTLTQDNLETGAGLKVEQAPVEKVASEILPQESSQSESIVEPTIAQGKDDSLTTPFNLLGSSRADLSAKATSEVKPENGQTLGLNDNSSEMNEDAINKNDLQNKASLAKPLIAGVEIQAASPERVDSTSSANKVDSNSQTLFTLQTGIPTAEAAIKTKDTSVATSGALAAQAAMTSNMSQGVSPISQAHTGEGGLSLDLKFSSSGLRSDLSAGGEKAGKASVSETSLPRSQQAEIINRVRAIAMQTAQGNNLSSITLHLDPQDLGSMTVKVTQRGDQLFARIIPESQEVEAMLRNRSQDVVQALTASGFKAENVTVSFGAEASDFSALISGDSLFGGGSKHQSAERNRQRPNSFPGTGFGGPGASTESKELGISGWVA